MLECHNLVYVLKVAQARPLAAVQLGLVLAHLDVAFKPYGLLPPVDSSAQTRCTLGGRAANPCSA